MNKEELKRSLIALNVNPIYYTISPPPYNDSSWVLEQRSYNEKKWSVFNFERGKRYDEKLFDTEDEACNYIYEKLKKQQATLNKLGLKHW